MDIPHHELLELAKAFVAQATPIVREQERLIDHLHGSPQDSRALCAACLQPLPRLPTLSQSRRP
jgi:hypothetical protein